MVPRAIPRVHPALALIDFRCVPSVGAVQAALTTPFPVYVLHVKVGYEARAAHMRDVLAREALEADWVLDFDIPDLDSKHLAEWFQDGMATACATTSCAAKHLEAWRRLLKSQAAGALVLEDDMFLSADFRSALTAMLEEAESRHSLRGKPYVLSLENSGLRFVPKQEREEGRLLYPNTLIRCAGAYYVSKEAAAIFIAGAKTDRVGAPLDWFMNAFFPDRVQLYWCHPTIAEQGSHNGKFRSGIDHKKDGLLRKLSWNAQRWFKSKFRSR